MMYVYPVVITIVYFLFKKLLFVIDIHQSNRMYQPVLLQLPMSLRIFDPYFLYSIFPTCKLFSTKIKFCFELLCKVTIRSKIFILGSAKLHILNRKIPSRNNSKVTVVCFWWSLDTKIFFFF